ncbi:hypothetical protein GUJ93_ZPchr0995g22924 [Zizania palustris]|uniref:Beta-adaptin appendage C-terminal subdomain domain-containing protein n=1 Tax=Zizania palustris TaxID=103762 RepID=A0A8J5RT64_ZIZPA|nr:hypothetical protein GUJ93_ZPchr0995g22924 [Zizania palustris]
MPDLLGDLMGTDNAIVPVDEPTAHQLVDHFRFLHCNLGPQPGTTTYGTVPEYLPWTTKLITAGCCENNQQPVWYFNDRSHLHVLFGEDGKMERTSFLEAWKSLPDGNEFSKDFPSSVINSIDGTIEHLAASNVFFIAKRKNANKDVLYMSAKIPRGIPFLIELTAAVGVPGEVWMRHYFTGAGDKKGTKQIFSGTEGNSLESTDSDEKSRSQLSKILYTHTHTRRNISHANGYVKVLQLAK